MSADEQLVMQGVHAVYEELGPSKTLRFFRLFGQRRGDTLRDLERITEKFSKQEALDAVRKGRKTRLLDFAGTWHITENQAEEMKRRIKEMKEGGFEHLMRKVRISPASKD
ncbi:hypothetical protein HY642_05320 [Candidatus Woesearchaeota archaeon]|nr:hypothetical protein [Candidatus Woesearchaeota archaeon]